MTLYYKQIGKNPARRRYDVALPEKFHTLSPDNKRLSLAFTDLLSDDFQDL